MNNTISLRVWGDFACFSRPELKVERLSYEVMTPSAARGILTAIYWKPEFRWVVDSIRVLNPICFTQVRRNELGCKVSTPSKDYLVGKATGTLGVYIEENRQQRAATILRDVNYIITAHVEVLHEVPDINNVAKHIEIFRRRAEKGQCFHQPCLGVREFPAAFEWVEEGSSPADTLPAEQRNRSFGLMLHDLVYTDDAKGTISCIDHAHSQPGKIRYKKQTATPHFFMAALEDGLMRIPALRETLS